MDWFDKIIPYLPALIMAILSVIDLIIKRKDKKEAEKTNINKELKDAIEKIKTNQEKMAMKIDENRRKDLRSRLVNEFSDMIKGVKKTKEQLQDIEDDYKEYTEELHGNTYVHDLHEIWLGKQKGE